MFQIFLPVILFYRFIAIVSLFSHENIFSGFGSVIHFIIKKKKKSRFWFKQCFGILLIWWSRWNCIPCSQTIDNQKVTGLKNKPKMLGLPILTPCCVTFTIDKGLLFILFILSHHFWVSWFPCVPIPFKFLSLIFFDVFMLFKNCLKFFFLHYI